LWQNPQVFFMPSCGAATFQPFNPFRCIERRLVFMPRKPKKPCKHFGCPKLTDGNYCEEHAPLHQRTSAADRGYNTRWQKARARFIKAHPLCVSCLKEYRMTKATVVDHIVPHRGDLVLFWDESNWQPLCKHCHDVKTMADDRYQEYRY